MRPEKKPDIAPPTQSHLFARDQVMQRAMGTTADPRITPMKVYQLASALLCEGRRITHVKPTHRDANVKEDKACKTHAERKKGDL